MKNSGQANVRPHAERVKAIAAFSGGLDSLLAAEVTRRAGADVILLHVRHLFSGSESKLSQLRATAERRSLPLRIEDVSEAHLETIRRPKHGYGQGMNPCLDCRILMLRVAKRVMEEEGAHFVVTGEVLGQRPKSQHYKALLEAAEESGLGDRLVRPLSANLLPDTRPVKEGWIHRESLLAIEGRSRGMQVALAKELGIADYPQPAGGCLLVEKVYAARLRDAFDHQGRDAVGLEAKGAKVLVADDSAIARGQTVKTLDRIGATYAVARDGREALTYLKGLVEKGVNVKEEVSMVISDIEMPEVDGYTLCKEIRRDPALAELYVLLHTSLNGSISHEQAEKAGADAILTKFVPSELAKAVIAGL